MAAWIALLLLVVAGLVLVLRADAGTIAGFDPSEFAMVVGGVALLIFLGSAVAGSYRGRAGQAARDLLAWVVVALVLVAGYSFREGCWSSAIASSASCFPPAAPCK
jgi:aspartyl protease family protein